MSKERLILRVSEYDEYNEYNEYYDEDGMLRPDKSKKRYAAVVNRKVKNIKRKYNDDSN